LEQFVTRTLESFIFPPGIFLILLMIGILLLKNRYSLAKAILWIGLSIFYLFSTPIVADLMISSLESHPALQEKDLLESKAGAIVILSGGRDKNAEEYGGDTVDQHTLLRCRYGAFLQRKTGLPILVSGGWVLDKEGKSLAQVMAEALREDFKAREVWLEDKSKTTGENALFSEKILAQKSIDTIYLVTQAWHMPRSVIAFKKTGLKVIPAPTAFKGGNPFKFMNMLPSANAINTSYFALHEMIGAFWYQIRY